MIEMWWGRAGAVRPARLTDGTRVFSASDRSVKAQAARLLVSLARHLLRATGRAYGAGMIGLLQVESAVNLSAKLRNYACRLLKPGARGGPSRQHLRQQP
jgi:hypothetical protein